MRKKTKQEQLLALERQLNRPVPKVYPYVLVVLIVLVHLLDSYASDVVAKIQSLYVNEFFVVGRGLTFEAGLQSATLISTLAYVFVMVAPFYKSLMDKIGRRPFFVFNTLGMGLGMLCCFFSPNFYVFAAGQVLISFFVMHDMQMIYIYEVAPAKWRSTLYFLCKFIGIFGTMAIPLFRDLYVAEDGTGWRQVFLIPVFACAAIFLISALLMRESDVFLKNRVQALRAESAPNEEGAAAEKETVKEEMQELENAGVIPATDAAVVAEAVEEAAADVLEIATESELAQEIAEVEGGESPILQKQTAHKTGIVPALKYVFSHNALKWLAITLIVTCTAYYAITMYFESFMSTTMSTTTVTNALFYQPIATGVVYLFTGFISDGLGRKKAIVIFSALCVVAFALFLAGVVKGFPPVVVGLSLGVYLGSFWNVTDINGLMFAESAPTELRGSIMGVQALLLAVGTAISLVCCMVLLTFLPLAAVMLIVGLPGLVAGAVLTMLKLKETKGADLSKIEY